MRISFRVMDTRLRVLVIAPQLAPSARILRSNYRKYGQTLELLYPNIVDADDVCRRGKGNNL